MGSRTINRRLAALQAFADRQRPALVSVHFTNGTVTTMPHGDVLGLLQELGPRGKIDGFQADGPMSGWAKLMTGLLRPVPGRRLSDYET